MLLIINNSAQAIEIGTTPYAGEYIGLSGGVEYIGDTDASSIRDIYEIKLMFDAQAQRAIDLAANGGVCVNSPSSPSYTQINIEALTGGGTKTIIEGETHYTISTWNEGMQQCWTPSTVESLTSQYGLIQCDDDTYETTTNSCVIATPETCTDGIQNQDETGIDTGGVCGDCEGDQLCEIMSDVKNILDDSLPDIESYTSPSPTLEAPTDIDITSITTLIGDELNNTDEVGTADITTINTSVAGILFPVNTSDSCPLNYTVSLLGQSHTPTNMYSIVCDGLRTFRTIMDFTFGVLTMIAIWRIMFSSSIRRTA